MILLLVLAAGAYYDVREHRIPNWWVAISMVCGILLAMVESGVPPETAVYLKEGGLFLARMLAVTALFFPLFFFRMIGAGDVKLAALICGYSGLTAGAAAIGLGFLMVKGSFHERFDHLTAYIRRIYHTKKITAYYDFARDGAEAVIPLGVCLLFGTMAFIMIPG